MMGHLSHDSYVLFDISDSLCQPQFPCQFSHQDHQRGHCQHSCFRNRLNKKGLIIHALHLLFDLISPKKTVHDDSIEDLCPKISHGVFESVFSNL